MLATCNARGMCGASASINYYIYRSQSFTNYDMLFHEDLHIKHALQPCLFRGYASQGFIFSRYIVLGSGNTVQLLVRYVQLQQAVL